MINSRKAKIVAKIADNKSDTAFLTPLFKAGVDVAWLNTAHQGEVEALEVINRIRAAAPHVAIMIDTKGPEIRTKNVEKPIEVKAGDQVIFTGDTTFTGDNVIHVSYPNFHNEVPVGKSILYDDASIETVVMEKLEKGLRCEVKSSGLIKNKKSLNIPDVHIALPSLTEKDKAFIRFCAKNDIDYIIHSFVRNKQDLLDIRDILKEFPSYGGKIISKIENREGFDNLHEILENCEGLMVARGDLGAEVLLEELPFMQKKMVEAALEMGKYSIVATQALESMIKNPRPTRAEVTDVANAILDGSDGVSMSGETAYGDYPVEATTMMGRIMKYTESKLGELNHYSAFPKNSSPAAAIAHDILTEARAAQAKVIVLLTKDMEVVRMLSGYRPEQLIIPVCTSASDARELMLAYAVRPVVASKLDASAVLEALKSSDIAHQKVIVVEQAGTKLEVKVK
ncbi:MAG: pyruvate kinase [Patescibacteria group bacterium]